MINPYVTIRRRDGVKIGDSITEIYFNPEKIIINDEITEVA